MRTKATLFVLLAVSGLAHAGSPGGLEITWSTIDGGGGAALTGGAVSLSGTIGQPDAGPDAAGLTAGGYSLTGGFWAMDAETSAGPCVPGTGDLDGDGDVDLDDYAAWERCFTGPTESVTAECPCADIDGDNDSDLLDFAEFQALFTGTAP